VRRSPDERVGLGTVKWPDMVIHLRLPQVGRITAAVSGSEEICAGVGAGTVVPAPTRRWSGRQSQIREPMPLRSGEVIFSRAAIFLEGDR
jgi:hypothetical protein